MLSFHAMQEKRRKKEPARKRNLCMNRDTTLQGNYRQNLECIDFATDYA